ncbi:MAG: sulfatase-like hydrolase/transferase, partial [Planctomycetota bacterium]
MKHLPPRMPCVTLLLLVLLHGLETNAAERPDMVIFLSDDHTYHDSSPYGFDQSKIATPNMDRLAKAGMTFDRAYVNSPACAPSRASLLTGLFTAHHQAEPNHARPLATLKKLPAFLQELGYEVVSFGKVGHYNQTPEYGFDIAKHFKYHEDIAIDKACRWLEDRRDERPLCLFVGTNWPHVPWPEIDLKSDEGADLSIPPTHADTNISRLWRARYVRAVENMDRDLGKVYDTSRRILGEDVFFLHTSDHGAQWPSGKWTLTEDGVRTPMIVSWRGRIEESTRSRAMVQWIDVLPTLVDVAGGALPTNIDGRSFLPVLTGSSTKHR